MRAFTHSLRLWVAACFTLEALLAHAVGNGDLNSDGVVDIDDVNLTINIMIHKLQNPTIEARADTNGDNVVDIDDLNSVINLIVRNGGKPLENNETFEIPYDANCLDNYWTKDANKADRITWFNVKVPDSGETNPDNCQLIANLNLPFITMDVNGKQLPVDAYKFEPDVTPIEKVFVFKPVSYNGVSLSVVDSRDANNNYISKLIKVTGTTTEVIATIHNNTDAYPYAFNHTTVYRWIELNKASKTAKELLNAGGFKVRIGMRAIYCGDDGIADRPLHCTDAKFFTGTDYFEALLVRPVYFSENSTDHFIDAVGYGNPGSHVKLDNVLVKHDWRDIINALGNVTDSKTVNTVELAKIPGNLKNSYLFSLPKWSNFNAYYGPWTDPVMNTNNIQVQYDVPDGAWKPNDGKFTLEIRDGELWYTNNGTVLQKKARLKVPITMTWGWGVVTHTVIIDVELDLL